MGTSFVLGENCECGVPLGENRECGVPLGEGTVSPAD